MRSLLALIAAAAMIVGALWVRGAFDGAVESPLTPQEPLEIVCATEVRAACDALAGQGVVVRTEEAGTTAAALVTADRAEVDAWLTLAPWPTMVAEARQRDGSDPLATDPATVLGRSPLVLAVWNDRNAVLTEACRPDYQWGCVGRVAGGTWAESGGEISWGPVKPGHGDPSLNATGLLVLGQAVTDFLGTSQFSARDLDDDAFLSWLSDLERAVPTFGAPGSTPLQQMLQFGPARFDVVGTTEAEAGPLLERSAGRAQNLTVRFPEPLAVVEVVLAPLQPDVADRLEGLVEPSSVALAAAGWRVEGQPSAPGVGGDPLPAQGNLPAAGVLEALRERWGEITR